MDDIGTLINLFKKETLCNNVFNYVRTFERSFDKKFISKKGICFICFKEYEKKSFKTHVLVEHGGKDFIIVTSKDNLSNLRYLDSETESLAATDIYQSHPRLFDLENELFDRREEVLFRIRKRRNTDGLEYKIQNILLYNDNNEFIALNFENNNLSYPFVIREEETLELYANKLHFQESNFKYSIFIDCLVDEDKTQIIEQHHWCVDKALCEKRLLIKSRIILKDQKMKELPDFPPNEKSVLSLSAEPRSILLNPINYTQSLLDMIEMEDYHNKTEFEKFNIPQVSLKQIGHTLYSINTKEIDLPPKIEDDSVSSIILLDMEHAHNWREIGDTDAAKLIIGEIHSVEKNLLTIELKTHRIKSNIEKYEQFKRNRRHISSDTTYLLRFIPNRISIRTEKFAIQLIERFGLSRVFFPDAEGLGKLDITDFSWFNKSVSSNLEQKSAIKHIVNGTAYPAPYIIFGPPGTGKTMTLVETICQIWEKKNTAKILVTAPSNAACNEIAARLIKYIPAKDLLRYFSKSHKQKDTDNLLYYISDNDNRVLRSHRIILCTLTTAVKLHLSGIEPGHFNYIMIDECGNATEPAALIPIAGVGVSEIGVRANIVLTGDPRQLGPVVISDKAEIMGLGYSMLDRLMEMNIYKKQPETECYNSRLITKLVRNFRSHPAILHISNELFYDNELTCCGDKALIDYGLNWKELPNKKFPIIFHSINGVCVRQKKDPSIFNQKEIDRVIFYIEQLFNFGINGKTVSQGDVGIVTPYRKQCSKLKSAVNQKHWNNIEVGSVEQYQGREKKIMILSTVRSNNRTIGFLNSEKRFNVALTRAHSLLIIIGNSKTLATDPNWRQLIEYCRKNNALISSAY